MTEPQPETAYMPTESVMPMPTEVKAYEPGTANPLDAESGMNHVGVLDGPVVAAPLGETYTDEDGQSKHVLAKDSDPMVARDRVEKAK